jgi:hypothetical protein
MKMPEAGAVSGLRLFTLYESRSFHLVAGMRRPSLLPLSFAAALVAAASLPLAAQVRPAFPSSRADTTKRGRAALSTIDGVVSDTNLVPLRGAFVTILGTRIRVGTGPNGRFRIVDVPSGHYMVIVRRAGFHPTSGAIEVLPQDTLRLAYTLEQSAASLDAVVVTEKAAVSARMRDFEQRRKLGFGEFLDAAEIDKRNSVFPTELFRKFMSINVSPSRSTSLTEYYALNSREGANPQLGACPMQIFVDDVPMPTPFNLDLLPSPRDLAGIEVYSGSGTIPGRYNGMNRGCGVVLVWTKDGV